MGLQASTLEQSEKQLGHAIVDNAFILDSAAFLGIEGRRIVLEVADYDIGVGSRIKLLGLSLIEHFKFLRSTFHGSPRLARFRNNVTILSARRPTAMLPAARSRCRASIFPPPG